MEIEALYDMTSMHPDDLCGILVSEDKMCGIVNNYPPRRNAVPNETIELFTNNNRTFRVYVKTPELSIINVAGAVGILTGKATKDSTIPTFTKSTAIAGQGSIGSPDHGEMFFYIVPADTVNIDVRQYVFNVKVTLSTGKVYTILEGIINLQQSIS